MAKVSIIMPLYNAQKYLEESLECVLNQTFTEFELICVNDGSSDATSEILKKFKTRDSRIEVLENEERMGAAYSRNRGMQKAVGKYLMFLDGDDIFDEEMLSLSFEAAEENDTDVLMFHYKHVPSEQIHNKEYVIHGENYINKYCKKIFSIEECEPYEFLLWSTAPWNKLFKRQFIMENEILFQNLSCANDVYFVDMALMLSSRTLVLNDSRVMVYARDHHEPSRISIRRDPMCSYKANEHLLLMLLEKDKLNKLYKHFFYSAFFHFKYAMQQTKEKSEAKLFYKFLQQEGIAKLLQLSNEYSNHKNFYIDYVLKQFEQKEFDAKWFEDETILKVCIKEKQTEFQNFFVQEGEYLNVAVWGAGQNGKTILQVCKEQNLPVKYVVDRNKKKQGTYIEQYSIMEPSQILDEIDTILISAQGIEREVREFVNSRNRQIRIVNIPDYFAIF